ncbi:MAG: hypothetical protein H7Y17_15510 [Chlorobia bacterium]|nr:hypothetical protein [Fimbriimonadaceae bacterium]
MKLNHITLAIALGFAALATTPANSQDKMDMKPDMGMDMKMTSTEFKGIEVNGGTVAFGKEKGAMTLTLSSDFKVPGSPAPHWQIVDAQGNVFLLQQLRIKDDKQNRSIRLPKYIKSVAKVQIWCSFAEVNLGEAPFKKPIMVK